MGRSYGARARARERERERDRVCRDRFVTVVYRAVCRALPCDLARVLSLAGLAAGRPTTAAAAPFLSHAKLSDTEIWRAGWQWPRRLYILCWSELSRRKLSPTLATPTTVVLTTLVAQCELSRRKIGLLLEVVGRKFSHRPGNPATVGVVRWSAAGDTAGSSLRRLNSLQHRIYNLLAYNTCF